MTHEPTPFDEACSMLPEGVVWGQRLTPAIAIEIISRARAALAAPVAQYPVLTEPDLTELHKRGREAWAGVDAQDLRYGWPAASPAAQTEPLSDDRAREISAEWYDDDESAIELVRRTERAHGIGTAGGTLDFF